MTTTTTTMSLSPSPVAASRSTAIRAKYPPASQHSATLIGDDIWIVGRESSSNKDEAQDEAKKKKKLVSMYCLDVRDSSMHEVENVDDGAPDWIHEHEAEAYFELRDQTHSRPGSSAAPCWQSE